MYSTGNIEKDGTIDFYWDTQFSTIENAILWGMEHNCNYIYNVNENVFLKIERVGINSYITMEVKI